MTDEQLNEWMAVNIMGWHIGDKELDMPWDVISEHWWIDENNIYMEFVNSWQPNQNITQALMCAEKSGVIMRIELMVYSGFSVRIGHDIYKLGKNYDELPAAICLVIYEARGK